jgi:hypothetical protein
MYIPPGVTAKLSTSPANLTLKKFYMMCTNETSLQRQSIHIKFDVGE